MVGSSLADSYTPATYSANGGSCANTACRTKDSNRINGRHGSCPAGFSEIHCTGADPDVCVAANRHAGCVPSSKVKAGRVCDSVKKEKPACDAGKERSKWREHHPPRTPESCYYFLPDGCPKRPDIKEGMWHKDSDGMVRDHSGIRRETCLTRRRHDIEKMCGTSDVKMHFTGPDMHANSKGSECEKAIHECMAQGASGLSGLALDQVSFCVGNKMYKKPGANTCFALVEKTLSQGGAESAPPHSDAAHAQHKTGLLDSVAVAERSCSAVISSCASHLGYNADDLHSPHKRQHVAYCVGRHYHLNKADNVSCLSHMLTKFNKASNSGSHVGPDGTITIDKKASKKQPLHGVWFKGSFSTADTEAHHAGSQHPSTDHHSMQHESAHSAFGHHASGHDADKCITLSGKDGKLVVNSHCSSDEHNTFDLDDVVSKMYPL